MYTLQDAIRQRRADDDAFWAKHPGTPAFQPPADLPDPRIGVLMKNGKHQHYITLAGVTIYGTIDELMVALPHN